MAVSFQILDLDKLGGEKVVFKTSWISELRIRDWGATLTLSKDLGH